FQALDETRLLATDIRPRAAMLVNVEVEVLAKDVFTEQIVRIRFIDGLLHDAVAAAVLITDVDVGGTCPCGITSQDDPLKNLMRVFLHENAIIKGARLAFVGIDAEVDWSGMVLGQKRPLDAAREAGTAA